MHSTQRTAAVRRRNGVIVAALAAAVLVPAACSNPFETDIKNPNAVIEDALGDPAGATTLVNGLGASVTRAMTAVWGPYHTATDELTWVGSREYWKNLDDGDVSDPVNEYTDGAYPFVSEARWSANFTIGRISKFDADGVLRNRTDLVRANVFGAIIYITIGDMFDDFVIGSDRTVSAANLGEAQMSVVYDSAVAMLDRVLPVANALNNAELQRQVLGLRARAKFSKAAWAKLRPARTAPTNALVNDAGAVSDATAMLAVGGGTPAAWRYRLTPTANNLAGINVGFEMNNRGELRGGNDFVIADPARPIVPAAGLAGIRMLDPVTGQKSPTVAAAIDACCRPAVGNNTPFTVVSAREMMLILAEARLAASDIPGFKNFLNQSRAIDGLPPYDETAAGALTPIRMLEYERKVQLYFQGRRLTDMYRFGTRDTRWLTTAAAYARACFLPITYVERQANLLAPQPNNTRLCQ